MTKAKATAIAELRKLEDALQDETGDAIRTIETFYLHEQPGAAEALPGLLARARDLARDLNELCGSEHSQDTAQREREAAETARREDDAALGAARRARVEALRFCVRTDGGYREPTDDEIAKLADEALELRFARRFLELQREFDSKPLDDALEYLSHAGYTTMEVRAAAVDTQLTDFASK